MHQQFASLRAALPRLLLVLLLPALSGLSGCASLAPAGHDADAGTAAAVSGAPRPYHEQILMGGRMSMRYQQNYTENVVYGSFAWEQGPDHTLVTLRSPLGQTVATIDITPASATLKQAGQAPQSATDVDSLAANALGWPLPISGLRLWLQGFVNQHGAPLAVDPQSRETLLTSDGWSVTYADWQTETGPARPKRIDLLRHTSQAGDIALRLVLDAWQPDTAAPAATAP